MTSDIIWEVSDKLAYLAIPYTGRYREKCPRSKRELSYLIANSFTAQLMNAGELVFSPITHSHHVADYMDQHRAIDHNYWMAVAERMMVRCDRLYIIPLDGWEQSAGVQHEMKFARSLKLPIFFLYEHHSYMRSKIHKVQFEETPTFTVRQLELFND